MFYIFFFLFLCIYYYKIIIFNIAVKRHDQLVDVSAIKVTGSGSGDRFFTCAAPKIC